MLGGVVVGEQGSIGRETVKSSDRNWKGKSLGLGAHERWRSSMAVRWCYRMAPVKESSAVERTRHGHDKYMVERSIAVSCSARAAAR
jgi:hypothetical protein